MNHYHAESRFHPCTFLLLSLAIWVLGATSASAIVDANSRSNTNAPADGAPWANIGTIHFASGIYLGAGWVLTTAHTGGAGDITLDGTLYAPDGTSFRLTNSTGSSNDLVMFHLNALPPLPRLPVTTTTPAALAQVDLIAFGLIAGSAQTNFGPGLTGFYWSSSESKSWGNNNVDSGGTMVIDAGLGPVTVFTTDFSLSGQTSDEAQAAAGDSGGGVFQKNGSTWELVGQLLYVANLTGQPANTSVYGDLTYAADIATYYPQIITHITNTIPSLSISRSGANAMVCWADTGANWKLLANHNLATTNWTVLSPTLTLTNGQHCALLPATNSPTFYRLQK
ncbi:MAG TPA: hypothetical protein VN578_11160 [Candidatus Binatia bacterium]|nr:hypothetical protein [Candidatus Binatia bacterium]